MSLELQRELAALRENNAHLFDPPRFRFIESMATRAIRLREPAQQVVNTKAEAALLRYIADSRSQAPQLESDQNSVAANTVVKKLKALRELLDQKQTPEISSASALELQLEQQEKKVLANGLYAGELATKSDGELAEGGSRPLQASQKMRVHARRRAIERRVELAIQQGPESPGPLNPQMLAIKALTAMRDFSPQYLNRYVNYLDALFWIERAADRPEPAKPAKKARKTTVRKK